LRTTGRYKAKVAVYRLVEGAFFLLLPVCILAALAIFTVASPPASAYDRDRDAGGKTGTIPLTTAVSAPDDIGFHMVGARPLYFGGLHDLAKYYETKTGIKIFSKAGGCSAAREEIEVPDKLAFGAWCCPVPNAFDENVEIVRIPIAMDAIVVYVHPSNPINNITIEQLRGIYRGEITRWSELGGADKPIVPLVRRHCEGLPEVFREKVVGDWGRYENVTNWLEVKSIKKMIENVEKFPLSIGYESYVFGGNDGVKIINIEGIVPNKENIRSKRYPFWRLLSLGVHKSYAENPVVKGFIKFTLGKEGQSILSRMLVGLPGKG